MTFDVQDFVKILADSGSMSPEEFLRFQEAIPDDQRPTDAKQLARLLVERKILTKLQARAILAGKTSSLLLGNYLLLDKIGEGGMARVYKAQHRRMKRVVAIKVLASSLTKSTEAIRRFHREIEAAAKLSHPNIVTAYDADEDRGVHFLVMEYVEGSLLSNCVNQDGPLSVTRAIDYALQAAKGLEYAHAEGIVHRDIKPGNLVLDKSGLIRILDMGLARFISTTAEERGTSSETELTGTGRVLGTIDYIAPEQATNTKNADHRSDIYSLGCTMYFLLTGRPPYTGETAMERLVAHREAPIPSLIDVRPGSSQVLNEVFRRMVAKRPEDRHASMSDVIRSLEAVAPTAFAQLKRPTAESFSQSDKPLPRLNSPESALLVPSAQETQGDVASDTTGDELNEEYRLAPVERDDTEPGITSRTGKCPECNSSLSDDAEFCVKCGYHLGLKSKLGSRESDSHKSTDGWMQEHLQEGVKTKEVLFLGGFLAVLTLLGFLYLFWPWSLLTLTVIIVVGVVVFLRQRATRKEAENMLTDYDATPHDES